MGVRQAWTVAHPRGRVPAADRRQRRHRDGGRQPTARWSPSTPAPAAKPGAPAPARRWPPVSAATGRWPRSSPPTTSWSPCEGGKVLWKQKPPAQAFTAPLVAGRRVFVQTADRTHQRLGRPERPPPLDPAAPRRKPGAAQVRRAAGRGRHPGGRRRRPAGGHQPRQRLIALGVAHRGAARHQRRGAPGRPDRQREPRWATSCARGPTTPASAASTPRAARWSGASRPSGADGVSGDERFVYRHRSPTAAWWPGAAPTANAPGRRSRLQVPQPDRTAGGRAVR